MSVDPLYDQPIWDEVTFDKAAIDAGPWTPPGWDAVTLEIAFASSPLDEAPVWTDVTTRLRAFDVRRGRQREVDRDEGATATFVLDNRDRALDPTWVGELVNKVINPSNEDATIDVEGYTGVNSAVIYGRQVTPETIPDVVSTYSIRVDMANVDGSGVNYNPGASNRMTAIAGLSYAFSLYTLGTSVSKATRLQIRWFDAGSVLLSVSVADVTMPGSPAGWQRFSMAATAPANTAYAVLRYLVNGAQGAFTCYTDCWQFEQAAAATAYVDGDQPGCHWAGTPSASVSYRGAEYYGQLLPMRPIRASIDVYPLFYGYIESYRPQWPVPQQAWQGDATVTVTARDAFKILNLATLDGDYPEEPTHDRITRVLDAVGWPVALRDIDPGRSLMAAQTLDKVNALQHVQDAVASERGRFWASNVGALTFRNRHASGTLSSLATFGDGPNEVRYSDLQPSYDDVLLYNHVSVTRQGETDVPGVEAVAEDTTSQAAYFKRSLVESGLLYADDRESADAARFLVRRYKDPRLRIDALTWYPFRDTGQQIQHLGRELGDRITIKRRPPPLGGTEVLTQDAFIESISMRVEYSSHLWEVVWQLSPLFLDYLVTSPWLLDASGSTVLGTSSYLRY